VVAVAPLQGDGVVWICPRCGARLVSRNLWHSCGQYTLETLFAGAAPDVLELGRAYVAILQSLGDVQVIPQKTRLVCVARARFAGLAPRRGGFQASFALHRWLDSPGSSSGSTTGRDGAGTASASRPAPIWMMSCAVGSRKPTMSSGCRLAWGTEPAAGHAPARALEATSAARPGAEHAAEVSSADLVALPPAGRAGCSKRPHRPPARTRTTAPSPGPTAPAAA
jgi:hypothetical protein